MKKVLRIIGAIFGILLFYVVCALAIPLIEVPAEKSTDPATTQIFILTNGDHTDLVLPVKSRLMDWSTEVPYQNTVSKRTDFKYVAIGWGDKGFYLDTPTWADLKFSTAFKAAFWLSSSAMHCTFYNELPKDEKFRKILLTDAQYSRLVAFVQKKFERTPNGKTILIPTKAVYGNNDAFYEARGKYSFLETCNTWANDGLKAAGQKAALWTPTDFGIFQHYR